MGQGSLFDLVNNGHATEALALSLLLLHEDNGTSQNLFSYLRLGQVPDGIHGIEAMHALVQNSPCVYRALAGAAFISLRARSLGICLWRLERIV